MKPLREILWSSFAAVAYAEAGEHQAAMAMAGIQPWRGRSTSTVLAAIERIFVAASFAEEGLHGEAAAYLGLRPATQSMDTDCFLDSIGLHGIRVQYVLARL